MSEVDPEIEAEEARLAKTISRSGQPVKINSTQLQSKSLNHAETVDKSAPNLPTRNNLLGQINRSHDLKPTETVDKSKPVTTNAKVQKNVHGQLFNEISAEKKPALKPTTTADKSGPVIETVQLKKSERPQLMSDIKEAGGTEGLVRQGSLSQKTAMFEKEISDHKKSQEKPEKKVVWAPKQGQNNYGKKTVYAKPEGGPPPKKTLAELL